MKKSYLSQLYTYPCADTGVYTESVRIYGNEIDESAYWTGYDDDWHNVTFDSPFTLESGKTYNYVMKTGSYPQIHHAEALQTVILLAKQHQSHRCERKRV